MRYLLASVTFVALLAGGSVTAQAAQRPNVIVVTTDDQVAATMNPRVMPNTTRLLVRGGAEFTRSIAATPLCCPSRSVFLTGQYGHNNGVLWNNPGYPDLVDSDNTLPVWMRRAGYRTAHIGKYPNGYEQAVSSPDVVAPGWSQWHTVLNPTYYEATYYVNGRTVHSGRRARDYITNHLNRVATGMIRRYLPRRRPLFMVVDQFAPHRAPGPFKVARCPGVGPEPAFRDRNAFASATLPRKPSFDEADVSDKPTFIRRRPSLTEEQQQDISRSHQCALASLQAVDRGVEAIWEALGKAGERRNTAILFTTDNAFFYGEHRLDSEKWTPYRESVEVPLAIRLPPRLDRHRPRRGRRVRKLVANVDLPATILDLGGARPCAADDRCRVLDGRSLVGLASGDDAGWPRRRAIPVELDSRGGRVPPDAPCAYQGIWTKPEVYVHYSAASDESTRCYSIDESEHYDLRADPFQLDNLMAGPPDPFLSLREAQLARRARELSTCTGIEGRDPPPPGRSYCE